jgi:Xaa-Pro aminopeptidase
MPKIQSRQPVPEISLKEKERRWSLLRQKLQRAGLGALIVYGGSQLGVPVHYLTRVWGTRMNMVIFPVDGAPVMLTPSNSIETPRSIAAQGCWIDPENIRLSPNLAADAARLIADMKLDRSKIGIDSFRWWPVFDYQIFSGICPGVQLVEAHRLFGEIRGSKSPEELALMRKAIEISDVAHYTFLAGLKPGLTEMEAAAPAVEYLDTHGVGDRIILVHSRPEATYPNRPGPTVIEYPNPVTFSPEFTLNRGYGAQMIRAYWWEKPKGIYKRMFELWAEMRQMVQEEFRPGVEITAAGRKIEDLVAKWGWECDKLGHAVGLSYGDAPYITGGPEEKDYMEWTILPGEVYAVHPMVRCKGYVAPFTMIGDMYYIGEERTERMTTALPGLPEYIPL